MQASPAFDVLGLGCVAIDDLLYVEAYPSADQKMPVQRCERQCGGLTATALVAAARLGARCAYAGALSNDELSEFALTRFRAEGVDVEHVVRQRHAPPVHSVIVVSPAQGTRNIFYDLNGVVGAHPEQPVESVIQSTRVLFVDNIGVAGQLRAAQIARAAGIPVVADLESDQAPRFAELLALVDHLVLPEEFAQKITGKKDPAAAAKTLAAAQPRTVVVTCGKNGCWSLAAKAAEPQHLPAFKVKVVDTTGCGDVFHGAYAAALARGLDLPQRLRFASAAAALKATRPGGQLSIPSLAQVEQFLAEN